MHERVARLIPTPHVPLHLDQGDHWDGTISNIYAKELLIIIVTEQNVD